MRYVYRCARNRLQFAGHLDVYLYRLRPRPHRRCWPSRPDLGERWPSRLVATAEEDRLRHLAQLALSNLGERWPSRLVATAEEDCLRHLTQLALSNSAQSWPLSRLSNVTGLYPARAGALHAWLPTKPAPPVTRIVRTAVRSTNHWVSALFG